MKKYINNPSSSKDEGLIPCWNAALNPEGDNKNNSYPYPHATKNVPTNRYVPDENHPL